MTFWRDKQGNALSFREFMARWKKGIEGVTPFQQLKAQMFSTLVMLLGFVCGIVVTLFAFKSSWWITIILLGGLLNTSIQYLGQWQKKRLLEPYYLQEKIVALEDSLSKFEQEEKNDE